MTLNWQKYDDRETRTPPKKKIPLVEIQFYILRNGNGDHKPVTWTGNLEGKLTLKKMLHNATTNNIKIKLKYLFLPN